MLTKEILFAYAPYGVQMALVIRDEIITIDTIRSIHDINDCDDLKVSIGHYDGEHIWMYKPLLRHLSSLTKSITHNGETFVPMDEIKNSEYYSHYELDDFVRNDFSYGSLNSLSYQLIKKLHEWHFDTFNCLTNGDAIELKELDNG